MRGWSRWLVVVPLMLAGTQVAHALTYRLVYPEARLRWQVLAATGHVYLDWFPLLGGVAGAIALIGLASTVADAARRRSPLPVPASAFGLLPLLGFALQEVLERWLAAGSFPWWAVDQPTFRMGLLLQLPFAAVAFLAARLLLGAARRVGSALGAERPTLVLRPASVRRPLELALPTASALARRQAGRAPPPLAGVPLPCR